MDPDRHHRVSHSKVLNLVLSVFQIVCVLCSQLLLQNPDILIVDEVLAVGDSKFQQKCIDRIQDMMNHKTTVLFVSHSIDQVKLVCNKVVWLEHGKLKAYGDTMEICEQYDALYGGR